MDDLERFIDEADRISSASMTLDTKSMKENGETLRSEDFSVEKFDNMVQLLRVRSNAETFAYTLSKLDFKGKPVDGEIKMIVTEDGIQFEGLEQWLPQIYAIMRPEMAHEAGAAAKEHLCTKRDEIEATVKRMFWRHTASFMLEDAELG